MLIQFVTYGTSSAIYDLPEAPQPSQRKWRTRSEEHTSELQSP